MKTYEQLYFGGQGGQSFSKIPPVVSKDKQSAMVNFGNVGGNVYSDTPNKINSKLMMSNSKSMIG